MGYTAYGEGAGAAPGGGSKEIVFQMTVNPAVIDTWVIWGSGGPWDGDQLAAISGGSAAAPTFASTWDDGPIHIPQAATIEAVDVVWGPVTAPSAAGAIDMMLVKYPLTDGMTAVGTVTDVASLSDTCAISVVSRNLASLTLNAATIDANDGLRFSMRCTGASDIGVNYVFLVTIRYS